MLRLPLHPRLARVVVEAEARGVGAAGCIIAALIGERDIRATQLFDAQTREPRVAATHGASDLLERFDLFIEAARANFSPARLRALELEPGAMRAVDHARRQLQRLIKTKQTRAQQTSNAARASSNETTLTQDEETALLISILAGYPDRVARRRSRTDERQANADLLLAGGGAAQLARASVVQQSEFLIAVEAEERRDTGRTGGRASRTLVRLASAIAPEWLLDLFPERVVETTEARWHEQAERVEASSRLLYDQLVLTETRASGAQNAEVERVLREAALAAGWQSFVEPETVERFLARVEFMART